ncbi:DUF2617 family protein [Nocardioides albus]|uniref:DUF2617 family protein n=1 Tax=Nocardioides albus TaxID=1841 RepID=A0A7W5A912_9ACTN|nr:DUF2617 family protein [Nocardioides albus]MBB3091564.1 hypothetical protein [Nocardioides albus]GGU40903.1 hypothetical protein GCM10007979_45110 [Nocardioides albus]
MTLLDVPFADVRGDTLCWTLDPVPCAPLASRTVQLEAGLSVTLSVLGASHQVVVRRHDRPLLHETIACGIADAAPLPAAHVAGGYRLESDAREVGPEELAAEASRLVERLSGRTDAVVAHFPGDPHAVTALALDGVDGEITWHTWHTYPQTGEIVATTTSYRPEEGISV